MNEDLRQVLKDITVRKMQIKHALEQYRKMHELTGKIYTREISYLTD